ncbi:hypothetical protein JCM3770_002591 [Rhodotorula araucariae]
MATEVQPPAEPTMRLNGYVGFDSLPQQIEHKLLKRGFQVRTSLALSVASGELTSRDAFARPQFNIIVVGESGSYTMLFAGSGTIGAQAAADSGRDRRLERPSLLVSLCPRRAPLYKALKYSD